MSQLGDAENIVKDTSDQLTKLLEATAEKARLETERIHLEQDKIKNQEEIIKKEQEHNQKLDLLLKITNDLNRILINETIPTVRIVSRQITQITIMQEQVAQFIILECSKHRDPNNDQENKEKDKTIEILKSVLESSAKARQELNFIGSVQSQNDVNISKTENSLEK